MVNRGGFVVETWLLSASLSGSKIFLFFKLYFLLCRFGVHGWNLSAKADPPALRKDDN
jgi:hypothetical protein